ncbi:hypothetical protein L6452_13312 [Arctium lappa]|uniref:Uncharacterized protein n=1 Tax=Arctium lappa TaxID=4217 RepID=A0ACB9CHU4_ARCLA|nr:hypothetical protein L6452_13312 [Arctium lappa]
MASNLYQILSILFFFFMTLYSLAPVVAQECPYPCYPPPIGGGGGGSGGGGNNPSTTTYPPPSQTGYYPPPSTIFPYNPPNPNYYGGGGGGEPQAPDPIVPWFPFYYKKPPHNPEKSSYSGDRIQSTVAICFIYLSSFLILVSYV